MNSDALLMIQVIAALVAAIGAFAAWRTTLEAMHATYRPVLRPIPHLGNSGRASSMDLFLKNIGRGPALSVMVFDREDPSAPLAETELIDIGEPPPLPLRPPTREEQGLRGFLHCNPFLAEGRRYRVVYQDIRGRWHETGFEKGEYRFYDVRYLGPSNWWDPGRSVPQAAIDAANVVSPLEPPG